LFVGLSDPFGIEAKRKRKAEGMADFFRDAKIPQFPPSSIMGKITLTSCCI